MNAREETFLQMNIALSRELNKANDQIRCDQEHIRQLQHDLSQYKPTFYKPRGTPERVFRNINKRLMSILCNFNRLLSVTGFKIGHYKLSDDVRSFDVEPNCPCINSLSVRKALFIKVSN